MSSRKAIAVIFPLSIVGPMIAGALVAVFHHLYFRWLNGRDPYALFDTERHSLPNLLSGTKAESVIGNAFVLTVKALFALSIMSSLTQIIWRKARARQFTVSQLDHLFGLPHASALPRILFSSLFWPLLPVLLVASSVYVLSFMTIVIPSSMVTTDSLPNNGTLLVPTVNMSAPPGLNVEVQDDEADTQPSIFLTRDFMRAMISEDPPFWSLSDEQCDDICSYNFSYVAPALQCEPLTSDQISDQQDGDPNSFPAQLFNWRVDEQTLPDDDTADLPAIYNGTSNIPAIGVAQPVSSPWTFTVALKSTPFSNSEAFGAACTFHNATYNVFTSIGALGQQTNLTSVHIGDPLSDPWVNVSCPWVNTTTAGVNDAGDSIYPPCMTVGLNARAMAQSFLNMMTGTFVFVTDGHSTNAVNTPIFSVDTTNSTFDLTDALGQDLSTSIEMLMAQSTLATLYRSNNFVNVTNALIDHGTSVWQYDPAHLLATYSILTAMTLVCAIYGLLSLYRNHSPGSFTLSHLLAATRGPGLSGLALNDDMHFLTPEMRDETMQYGKVFTDGRWIHSFGIVGKDEIVSLNEDVGKMGGK